MSSNTERGRPFTASEPHCGVCKYLRFRDDWERTSYCTVMDQTTSITVGDICSEFELRSDLDEQGGVEVEWTDGSRGTEAPFYPAYDDDEQYGLLCGNCRTLDVAVGPMGRVICNRCENTRRPTDWDRAYL